jgi:VWFA-related protein
MRAERKTNKQIGRIVRMTVLPPFAVSLRRVVGAALLAMPLTLLAQTAPYAPQSTDQTNQPPSAPLPAAPLPQGQPPRPAPKPVQPGAPPAPALHSLPPSTSPMLPATAPTSAAPATNSGTQAASPSSAPGTQAIPAHSTNTAPAGNPATPTLQQHSPEDAIDASLPTLRVQANEVNLTFTVTDKKGHFVQGLHPQDFGLLDDGVPPSRISGFNLGRDLPLRVGIMLDTSSSIRSRFSFEQQAAVEFLLQVLHQNDRAFIEGFDIQTDLAQDFSNNIDLLSRGVERLRPGGGTAFYDAVYKTCRDQMLGLRDKYVVRRAIILVSDGEDDYSRALESDAIKMCQRSETTVYTISTDTSASRSKGDDVLQAIANATGGRAFFPGRIDDVSNAFHSVELELRSQYALQYTPANFKADGSFRTIYLHTTHGDYTVHTRTGYFAPQAAQ